MSKQGQILLILITILGLAGCKTAAINDSTDAAVITSTSSIEDTQPLSPTEESTIPPTAIYVSAGEDLWVEIDSPADGAVVTVPQVEVTGKAAVGTTLTINDDILYLENDEHFSDQLNLVEGANLIDVLGSDMVGNEVSLNITVYYEP